MPRIWCRITLVAVDPLSLSYGEAGRSLGVPEATVATRLRALLGFDRVSHPRKWD
ncbi:MAG TPA: hypothetical protein VH299_01855 [Solirubrobacterales bacterium]|jgi:DNA-directed RNA polymerase specialized sigma24 family protein|nr:hypothetical protein [Solirubrobacterales bacterium]